MKSRTREVLSFLCTLLGVCCLFYVLGELVTLNEAHIARAIMGTIYGLAGGYYFNTTKR